MAITLWKVRDIYVNPDHHEFIIDSSADIQYLPNYISNGSGLYTHLSKCAIGSLALIPNGDTYILDNANSWSVL